jgi:hypothetical protein
MAVSPEWYPHVRGAYLEEILLKRRVELVRREREDGNEEETQQLERGSNTVCDERLDALEDLAGNDDGLDNDRETFVSQDLGIHAKSQNNEQGKPTSHVMIAQSIWHVAAIPSRRPQQTEAFGIASKLAETTSASPIPCQPQRERHPWRRQQRYRRQRV